MAALTTALLALTAAKTVGDYTTSRNQANAAVAQGEYQGQVYDQNATLADAQATDAIRRGQVAENMRDMATRQTVGAQRANYAAQGVDIGSGSALAVQKDTAYLGALDRQTIATNAAREAWGYGVQATQDRNNAKLARAGGQATAEGIRAQGRGTLLTNAFNLYAQGKAGGFGGGSGTTGGLRVPDNGATNGHLS